MNKPKIPEEFEEFMNEYGEWRKAFYSPKEYNTVEFVCFFEGYEFWKARHNFWKENDWNIYRNRIKKRCKECGHILEDENK